MTGPDELDRFLRTDPRDVGCARAVDMLHVYVELVAAGEPALAASKLPGGQTRTGQGSPEGVTRERARPPVQR